MCDPMRRVALFAAVASVLVFGCGKGNVRYRTPESTFKAFLGALRNLDAERILDCCSLEGDTRAEMEKEFRGKSKKEIDSLRKEYNDILSRINYSIEERKQVSETEVHLRVKTTEFSDAKKTRVKHEEVNWIGFRLEEDGWKIADM